MSCNPETHPSFRPQVKPGPVAYQTVGPMGIDYPPPTHDTQLMGPP